MKYKIISPVLILLAIIFSWFFMKKDQTDTVHSKNIIDQLTYELAIYKSYFPLTIDTESRRINSGIAISSQDGSEFSLKAKLKGKTCLVFRYSYASCQDCIDQVLKKLDNLSKRIGKENIIILSSYPTFRDYKIYLDHSEKPLISSNFFIEEDGLSLPIEKTVLPFIFLSDESGRVDQVFIPAKELPDRTDNYLKILEARYFGSSENGRSTIK